MVKYAKTIVCLANSRKTGGTCVAGKEVSGETVGEWIRPVSERPSREVSERERQFADGGEPQLLDIVTIPMRGHLPQCHQTENQLIDPEYYWAKEGVWEWDEIPKLLDYPQTLWANGYQSYSGRNNRVPAGHEVGGSLHLIQCTRLEYW